MPMWAKRPELPRIRHKILAAPVERGRDVDRRNIIERRRRLVVMFTIRKTAPVVVHLKFIRANHLKGKMLD